MDAENVNSIILNPSTKQVNDTFNSDVQLNGQTNQLNIPTKCHNGHSKTKTKHANAKEI